MLYISVIEQCVINWNDNNKSVLLICLTLLCKFIHTAPSEVGVWGGVSPLQPTRGELPNEVLSPGRKRILAYFEGHRTIRLAPISYADALS